MRFGIIANRKRPNADQVIKRALNWLSANDHEYLLADDLREFAPKNGETISRKLLAEHCDMIISMGGDGTLLAAARDVAPRDVPILGINLGSLGFLTQIAADEVETRLAEVVSGRHQIQKRMLLEAVVVGDQSESKYFALNDVVVDRGSLARLVQLDLYVNDEFICTYRADGLIICTPTGSTAYNSAVGGPILNPNMEAMVASPMAPQSLAARPLLFAADDVILIRISSPQHTCLMSVDGQVSVNLTNHSAVVIRKAAFSTKLVTFSHNSFYQILRKKLHWAVLPRSEN